MSKLNELNHRNGVVFRALLDALDHLHAMPRETPRDERIEWCLIRDACRRETQRLKGQITRARNLEAASGAAK